MEIKGIPPDSLLDRASRTKVFFTEKRKPILKPNSSGTIRTPNARTLEDLMGDEDPLFVDFISKCIEWERSDRMNPEEALSHQWIQEGLLEITGGSKSE